MNLAKGSTGSNWSGGTPHAHRRQASAAIFGVTD